MPPSMVVIASVFFLEFLYQIKLGDHKFGILNFGHWNLFDICNL